MSRVLLITLCAARLVIGANLALTPPMGWISDAKLADSIDDKTVRAIADAMVSNGLKDAGYNYVVIDGGWQGARDAQGNIQPNPRFPDLKALADYVHSKGLKLGIDSSPLPKTCAGLPGSAGSETQDAKTWASWGIDYVMADWCDAAPEADMQAYFKRLGDALKASGRDIVFSMNGGGQQNMWEWGATAGANLWRTTAELKDSFANVATLGLEKQMGHEKYAGPGHWNDPGILQAGRGGMTPTESKMQFSLWAILAAPLFFSADPREMSDEIRQMLITKEALEIDQDKLGQQGFRISKEGGTEVWEKRLENGDLAVAFFNRSERLGTSVVYWDLLNLKGKHKVRDIWTHADYGQYRDAYSATVGPHGAVLLRISR